MTVHARRTGDFDGDQIDLLPAVATVAAIGGAVGAGVLAERIGPRRVVLGTLAVTVVTLLVTSASTRWSASSPADSARSCCGAGRSSS